MTAAERARGRARARPVALQDLFVHLTEPTPREPPMNAVRRTTVASPAPAHRANVVPSCSATASRTTAPGRSCSGGFYVAVTILTSWSPA